jgi:hypothetical protein
LHTFQLAHWEKRLQHRITHASLFLILIGIHMPCWAGPPFITDDPEPLEPNHWEINTAVSASYAQGQRSLAAPSIDMNYGLLPDMQIHMQPRMTYERTDGHENYGVDNTEIGVKYRFLNHRDADENWMMGIYPMLMLPTAGNTINLGNHSIQAFLPLWLQWASGDWTIYGGAGYRINHLGPESRNSCFTGVTALKQLTNNLQAGIELFHESSQTVNDKAVEGFNVGGKLDLSERYHLLFSVGKGLDNVASTNQFSSYLALQVAY